ncbi:MAG: 2Fe-2S iron-sulfur cluster binding domain-containing protein [Desulfobacterales bacterium]|nr:2Fe-2S iron-sulfur cluster binding domain-containing protein [Desulfobacterales bacterium]
MHTTDIRTQIEGYNTILKENEILRRYARDRTTQKGQVAAVIDRLHPAQLQLRVTRILAETASTKTFRLVTADGRYLPPFQAGQYINLFVEIGGVRTSRPYSVSSPPTQTAYYDITVRRVPDGFVSIYLLDEVLVGQVLTSTSPAGTFYHNPLFHGDDLVLIGGGSGITPFMSMIREVTDRGGDRQVHLVYGSRVTDDIIFGEELQQRAAAHDNLTVTPVISEPAKGYAGPSGFITGELLLDLLGSLDGKMFYLCGPEVMYTFVKAELLKLGIPERRIRIEVYGPPADVTAQPGWPEAIKADDRFKVSLPGGDVIPVSAGEPLMAGLERAGLTLNTCCRSGECSLCRTLLLAGNVFHAAGAKLRKSDSISGYIHPCMAYPLSDLSIMI